MSDAYLSEIYQECYAIRSRIEYFDHHSELMSIDKTLNLILRELQAMRKAGGGASPPPDSVGESSTSKKSGFGRFFG